MTDHRAFQRDRPIDREGEEEPVISAAKLCASVAVSAFLTMAPAAAQELSVEVMHPWTSGGESAAAGVFASQFEKAGGVWVDRAIAGNDALMAAAMNRIVGGNPPSASHFNTGKPFEELVDADLLRDVDAVAGKEGWAAVIPPTFLDAVTRDGKIMAVPINLQTENWIWYSMEVFEKAGVGEPPQSWDDFFVAADKIKAAGFIPMALGGGSWAERFVFQKVLVSVAGPELYLKILRDRDVAALQDPKVQQAFEVFGKLRGYVDPGSSSRKWNDATNLVITNKAGFQIMGDWAKGEFAAAGLTPGKEYGCTLFPGQEVSIMSGDVFVMPKLKDEKATEAQTLLASVLFAPDTQLQFNMKKGSNPIRQDIDVSAMDVCAQHAAEILKVTANQVPNPQFLMSNDALGAVRDVITAYWNNPAMTAAEMTTALAKVLATVE
jgi:glucose/mannose transport system substrate-binding protein